jgi:hypothetical protein
MSCCCPQRPSPTPRPDGWAHVVEDVIAEGDKVVARNTVTGTHQGEYKGLPPTGKSISYSEIFIFRFAGGRIAEIWRVVDVLAQMKQLGMLPA